MTKLICLLAAIVTLLSASCSYRNAQEPAQARAETASTACVQDGQPVSTDTAYVEAAQAEATPKEVPVEEQESKYRISIKPIANAQDEYHDFAGTSWLLSGNDQNRDGELSNGKDVTQANVTELLDAARAVFPSGTLWAAGKDLGPDGGSAGGTNNNYSNPGPLTDELFLNGYNFSAKTACGGFTALLSDVVFGANANPYREMTDYADLHIGDIILGLRHEEDADVVSHTVTVTGLDPESGLIRIAEGNAAARIAWHDDEMTMEEIITSHMGDEPDEIHIYTRWPE